MTYEFVPFIWEGRTLAYVMKNCLSPLLYPCSCNSVLKGKIKSSYAHVTAISKYLCDYDLCRHGDFSPVQSAQSTLEYWKKRLGISFFIIPSRNDTAFALGISRAAPLPPSSAGIHIKVISERLSYYVVET